MVPKKIFFTKGVGKHKERLPSFELALRDAGIASQNLRVRVSSIFPPRCKVISRKEGLTYLNHGEVVFSVIARTPPGSPSARRIEHRRGYSADRDAYGYLSEHHSLAKQKIKPANTLRNLRAEMLATTLDVDFDPDKSWDEKKEIYHFQQDRSHQQRYAVGP
jgi:arginine decarboxylase